jgi:glycosyltransferase involved in cell wall biosynthesis
MISVVIATHESERLLVPTLSALVPGAIAGVVREVIVADAGSQDATATIADIAGCRFEVIPGPLGARLREAAGAARGRWLLFLKPGSVPDPTWIDEVDQFMHESELGEAVQAAVFRPRLDRRRLSITARLALIATALGLRPKPHLGLLIPKALYEGIGGHNADAANPEAELLRRLGHRRICVLGGATVKTLE